jgi:hypothetical protein
VASRGGARRRGGELWRQRAAQRKAGNPPRSIEGVPAGMERCSDGERTAQTAGAGGFYACPTPYWGGGALEQTTRHLNARGGAWPGCQMRRGADERARVRRGTTHRWASRGSFYRELKLFRNENWSGKIARNGKKSRKNCGGRKSNLEHLSMLQLFPNLHKF